MAPDAMEMAVRAGRRAAESTFRDSCTITVPGDDDPDPMTGESPRVTVYPDPSWPADHPWKRGPCKVQSFNAQETNPEAAGAVFTVQRYRVDVPVGSFEPIVGAEVTMGAVVFDPLLTGRTYRVVGLLHKTAATAYRLAVEEG